MPRNGGNRKIVFASVRCDGHEEGAQHDAAQAKQAALVKRRLYEMEDSDGRSFFQGNLYSAINNALKEGKISQGRADRWHKVRDADNYCKHDEERLKREKTGGSGGGGGGGGGGGRRRHRRRRS